MRSKVSHDAGHHFRDRRAARHLDDGLVGDDFMDRGGLGRVGLGGLHATPGSAGAPGDHGLGVLGHFLQALHERAAAVDAEHAVFIERRIAFHRDDVIAFVPLGDVVEDGLGLVAGGGHQGVVVIERKHRQDHILGQRVCRADERLRTTGAFKAVQPEHRGARLVFKCMRNPRDRRGAQPQRCGGQAAELEKAAPGDALAAQYVVKGLGHLACLLDTAGFLHQPDGKELIKCRATAPQRRISRYGSTCYQRYAGKPGCQTGKLITSTSMRPVGLLATPIGAAAPGFRPAPPGGC